MGGKPSKGTQADKRLRRNQPKPRPPAKVKPPPRPPSKK